jgi:hypothetical protein
MPHHRARKIPTRTTTVALALLAAIAVTALLDDADEPGAGAIATANAAAWRGEVGVFNFAFVDGPGKRKPALLEGGPKGERIDGTVARQSIFWSCVQPKKGAWEMDGCRQVGLVDDLQATGWNVQVVLRTKRGRFVKGPFWATDWPGQQENPDVSYAPVDILDEPSSEFGYSKSFYDYVSRVIDRYCDGSQCRIHSLVFGNESNSREQWTGRAATPESDVADYVRLVATTRKAIDDSGARLLLFDSGVQGYAVLWHVLNEELEARGPQAAAVMYSDYFNAEASPDKIGKMIRQRVKRPPIAKINMFMASDLHRYTDGVNFHHYQTPQSIPALVAYLRKLAPPGHLIANNEVGVREKIVQSTDKDLINAWMIQKMVYLLDSEVSPVIWFTILAKANLGGFTNGQAKFKPAHANAWNSFASLVGDGVTDVSMETVEDGGQALVRAVLKGSEGRFAVEWFDKDQAGDWAGVTGPAGCERDQPRYANRYLRVLTCD